MGDKCLLLPVHASGALRHKKVYLLVLQGAWRLTCVLTTQISLPENAWDTLILVNIASSKLCLLCPKERQRVG